MTDFLNALKADLLDRRLLPLLALVGVALAAALAYAVLGGGSTAATPTAAVSTAPATAASSGLAISHTTPEKAVAETTSGVSVQHRGAAHNPFALLQGAAKSTASTAASSAGSSTTSASSGSSTSSTTSGSSSSSQGTGGSGSTTPSQPSTPATPAKPAKPAKPQTVYHVAVLFGVVPAGAATQSVQLTPYENLKLLTPLPSAKQPLVVFRGVTVGGKSATFTLVGEAILHGNAACLPSATQCQAIDLKPGESEQLEYLPPSGQTVVYELRIVSIASSNASTASVKSLLRGESKAGRELLRRAGLVAIPDLHNSSLVGVLVFGGHPAFAAPAHTARHRRHRG
jgi:hypothetical protein